MKRFTSVLIAVILGALATGIGTVPFLVLANQDRHRLDNELQSSKNLATQTEIEKQRIAEEANRKVEEANEEVQKAQMVILEAQEDARLLAESRRLEPPTTREKSKLNQVVSLYQGISLFLPTGYTVTQDEPSNFIIAEESKITSSTVRVLYIQPYDETEEHRYINAFASSTHIALVAGGRLIKGIQGTLLDGSIAITAQIRSSAKTTHLIWMRDPAGSITKLEKMLATIEYQDK
jgi:hypothetical protein